MKEPSGWATSGVQKEGAAGVSVKKRRTFREHPVESLASRTPAGKNDAMTPRSINVKPAIAGSSLEKNECSMKNNYSGLLEVAFT